jgi:hypothetical protein
MKSLLRRSSIGLAISVISTVAHAEAPSLRIPGHIVGARPSALGGAFTAVADDQNALFYNPAGLAKLDSTFAALVESTLSVSLGSGGIGALMDDFDKISASAKDFAGNKDTLVVVDSISKIGDVVSSRTAATGLKLQGYWAQARWGMAYTSAADIGLGVHAKILPEIADIAILADQDLRFGYAHRFLDGKLNVGVAPYYKLRAQGGRANISLAEAVDPKQTLKNIIGIGHGGGVDVGLMVTPIEAMSPTFGLAIQNLGDTRLYKTGSSAFSNVEFLKDVDVVGAPDLIKQIVNVGFSVTPVDGAGFVRLSGELKEINRPSAAELKPAFGAEAGFRSRYIRALVDGGWGNGGWSAGVELRSFIKLRLASYIEPNLFFDRKANQRVWLLSLGL